MFGNNKDNKSKLNKRFIGSKSTNGVTDEEEIIYLQKRLETLGCNVSGSQVWKRLDGKSNFPVEEFLLQFENEWDKWSDDMKLKLIGANLSGNAARWFNAVKDDVVINVESFIREYQEMFGRKTEKSDEKKMVEFFSILNKGLRPGQMEDDCWILFENYKEIMETKQIKKRLKKGDIVMRWNEPHEKMNKLDEKWSGPFRIIKELDNGAYKIESLTGVITSHNQRKLQLMEEDSEKEWVALKEGDMLGKNDYLINHLFTI
ncbi:hypothetical protein H312_01111, partial [Anncaliia algerae PRA339]